MRPRNHLWIFYFALATVGMNAQDQSLIDFYDKFLQIDRSFAQLQSKVDDLTNAMSKSKVELERDVELLGGRLQLIRELIAANRKSQRDDWEELRREMRMLDERARALLGSRFVMSSPREGVLIDYTAGTIRLENKDHAEVGSIGADDGKGSLSLSDSSGFKVVRVSSNAAGGFIKLQTPYGRDLVYLGGGESQEQGGFSEFRSASSKVPTRTAYIGTSTNSDGVMELYAQDGEQLITVGAEEGSKTGRVILWGRPVGGAGAANKVLEISAEPQNKGAIRILGTPYADLLRDYAEIFEFKMGNRDYLSGTVMSVADMESRIDVSTTMYDPRVVGVLSGAGNLKPGVVIGIRKDGSSDLPVAVAGQVNVRVCPEGGRIQIGDLLVSSSTPGLAMRGSDPDRLLGTVIGKALEPYAGIGEGLIRMLVMLR